MADDDDPTAGDEAAADEEAGAAAGVVDEDELHAAAPMATLAAIPDTPSRRRFFTVYSLIVFLRSGFWRDWLSGGNLGVLRRR